MQMISGLNEFSTFNINNSFTTKLKFISSYCNILTIKLISIKEHFETSINHKNNMIEHLSSS